MSQQEEPPLGSYQFTEYGATPLAPPYLPSGYGYSAPAPGYPPVPYPLPFVQAASKAKKPICFPLTRNASVSKQVVTIAIFSVLMTILFAGNIAAINQAQENQMPGNVFIHPDGTVNGVLFLLAGIFLFLTLPAVALLSGAFLGAVRALLATFIVVGSTTGLWLAYTFLQHIP